MAVLSSLEAMLDHTAFHLSPGEDFLLSGLEELVVSREVVGSITGVARFHRGRPGLVASACR
jgi:hypothetical protein